MNYKILINLYLLPSIITILFTIQTSAEIPQENKGFMNRVEVTTNPNDIHYDKLHKVISYIENQNLNHVTKPNQFYTNKKTVVYLAYLHFSNDLDYLLSDAYISSRHRLLHILKLLAVDADVEHMFLESKTDEHMVQLGTIKIPNVTDANRVRFKETISDETKFKEILTHIARKTGGTNYDDQFKSALLELHVDSWIYFNTAFPEKIHLHGTETMKDLEKGIKQQEYKKRLGVIFDEGNHKLSQFAIVDPVTGVLVIKDKNGLKEYLGHKISIDDKLITFLDACRQYFELSKQSLPDKPEEDIRARNAVTSIDNFFKSNHNEEVVILNYGQDHQKNFQELLSHYNLYILTNDSEANRQMIDSLRKTSLQAQNVWEKACKQLKEYAQ